MANRKDSDIKHRWFNVTIFQILVVIFNVCEPQSNSHCCCPIPTLLIHPAVRYSEVRCTTIPAERNHFLYQHSYMFRLNTSHLHAVKYFKKTSNQQTLRQHNTYCEEHQQLRVSAVLITVMGRYRMQ
jgi:hypothetical protein